MANPKKKPTRMRRNMRRSANWKVAAVNASQCTHCGSPALSHRVCPECGFYQNELILPRKIKKKDEEKPE